MNTVLADLIICSLTDYVLVISLLKRLALFLDKS